MMEQSHLCEYHCHIILVAGFDYVIVTNRSARLRDIANTASSCALDVVAEREECVAAQRHACYLREISFLLLTCERLGAGLEILLPYVVAEYVLIVIGDIYVYYVISVGSTQRIEERQVKHLVMLTKMPYISLASGKSCAVNSRLLTCAYADSLTVNGKAYGVGLCVFESNKRNDKIYL